MAVALKSSTSLTKGTQLRSSALRPRPAARVVKVNAKYGEESRFFDLNDLSNTTASWDMYGQEDKKRYPAMQNTFFERAAEPVSRREYVRAFLALIGGGGVLAWGVKGSGDTKLPITKGPLTSGENGKGGSVSSKL